MILTDVRNNQDMKLIKFLVALPAILALGVVLIFAVLFLLASHAVGCLEEFLHTVADFFGQKPTDAFLKITDWVGITS